MMLQIILQSVYYFLPAYMANMAPIVLKRCLPDRFAKPIDAGMTYRSKRVLGANKTWRGLILGVVSSAVVMALQLAAGIEYLEPFDYASFSVFNILLLGALLGFGALFGDMVKSFVKRQVGHKPGKPWVPWDQVDFIVGALLFSFLLFIPSIQMIITIVITAFVLNLLVPYIGYRVGINEAKF